MIIDANNKEEILNRLKDFDNKVTFIDFDGEMIKFCLKRSSNDDDFFYTIYYNEQDKFFLLMDKYDMSLKEEELKNKINNKDKFIKKSKKFFMSVFFISSSLLIMGVSHPLSIICLSGLSITSGIGFVGNSKIMSNIVNFYVEEGLSDIRKNYLIDILKKNNNDNNLVKTSNVIELSEISSNDKKISELVKIKEDLLLEKDKRYIGN